MFSLGPHLFCTKWESTVGIVGVHVCVWALGQEPLVKTGKQRTYGETHTDIKLQKPFICPECRAAAVWGADSARFSVGDLSFSVPVCKVY